MPIPVTVRLVNTSTGEILFTKVFNDFVPGSLECKDILYRYIDCLCRGLDKQDDTLKLEYYSNKYPAEPGIF